MNRHELVTTGGHCLEILRTEGFEVRFVRDLNVFERRMEGVGKRVNYPMVSPRWHDFAPADAFGLVLERRGSDIGGVAARYHNLSGTTLAEYWAKSYARLYGASGASPVSEPAPLACRITGKVAYLGELYIAKKARGGVASGALLVYLQALTQLEWDLDWVYGFMRAEDVDRGKATRYGFSYQVISAQMWHTEPADRASTEFLVGNDRDALGHMAARISTYPNVFLPGYATPDGEQKDKMKSAGPDRRP